jgi:hypothetical protein
MRTLALMLAIALSPWCFAQTSSKPNTNAASTSQAPKPETSHLAFVSEYIRELAAIEDIRESGEEELKAEPKSDASSTASTALHSSTLFQLELESQIKMLRSMRLRPPLDHLIPVITTFYKDKIRLWKRMDDINSAFIGGPGPGVDYGKLVAEIPKIRGQLDFIDQALFEGTPSVFATLIDLKPDSKGQARHLIITKNERAKLIDDLNTDFGSKLDEKGPNYSVGSASVLKGYLLKDYKCSDEPWD